MGEGRHRKMLWIVLGAALLLGAVSLMDRDGFRQYFRLEQDVERLTARNTRLAEQNRALLREIDALRDDPRALERAAREELGYVKAGEIVIQLEGP